MDFRWSKMRLIETYTGYHNSEFGIGRFYRSDIRKLNALRLYYDFPLNSRMLFNEALDGKDALLGVLKRGKRVIGYMMYEFPMLGNDDNLWLFRIPQRITAEDFVEVADVVSYYCEKVLCAQASTNIHIFNKTKE